MIRRRLAAALTGLGLTAGFLAAVPPAAQAVDHQGTVRSPVSGKYLAKAGANAVQSATGLPVEIRPVSGSSTEHTVYGWDGANGWCLTGSASASPANNTQVTWQTCTWQAGPQRWTLPTVSGGVQLVNVPNGKALNLGNASTAEGARLSLYTRGGWATEVWTLATGSGGSTPTPTPTTPPPSPGSPSGQAMPASAPAGWTRIMGEEFTTTVPQGSWPGAYDSRFDSYDGFRDTGGAGLYDPTNVVSAHDGILDYHMRTIGGVPRVAAETPLAPGVGWNGLTEGRYTLRMRSTGFNGVGYKTAFLLWATDVAGCDDLCEWNKGEEDFPETGLEPGGTWKWYHHWALVGDPGRSDAYEGRTPINGEWHTGTLERTSTSIKVYVDGVLLGTATTRLPKDPMRWTLQAEVNGKTAPPAGLSGHVEIDWLTIDRRS